jgi:hypothetical protein
VVVSSTVTGTSAPTAVDQHTGAFSVTLPITSAINCDDEVAVTAACASNSACSRTVRNKLYCIGGCYRAKVTQTSAPCTGTPLVQPVTLDATINVNAGVIQNFFWDFGDGNVGPPFVIDNSAGTGSTAHTHTETHDYAPGTYTATLKVLPQPVECDQVSVTVVAQCASCQTITVNPPTVAPQCVGGKRTVTLTSQVTAATGQLTVVQWDFGDAAPGTALGPATVVNPGMSVTYTETHDYTPPGLKGAQSWTSPFARGLQNALGMVTTCCPDREAILHAAEACLFDAMPLRPAAGAAHPRRRCQGPGDPGPAPPAHRPPPPDPTTQVPAR